MRILILSFYFRPDLSAGSFRISALVEALLQKIDENSSIDVITTMPNRYSGFESLAEENENHPRLNIHRISLPSHKSGMFDQSLGFLVFARSVMAKIKDQNYSFIFATSSRLMTAALGEYISRRKKIGIYLDIRDIFVDTLNDVMSRKVVFFLKPIFSIVERFTFSSVAKINLVSEGFRSYFFDKYPNHSYSFFTNGIDNEFLDVADMRLDVASKAADNLITVLYAGNMGEGQGLHAIIPDLAKRLEGEVKFRLIGDGGRKALLEKNLAALNCRNVELLPPVPRDKLIAEYQRADVLFLHLNNYKAFEKVLPSKLFEYGAFEKPVWAGVAGYAAEFVANEMDNAVVFSPCDVSAAVSAYRTLNLSSVSRKSFIRKFSRANIMNSMASDIINIAMQSSKVK